MSAGSRFHSCGDEISHRRNCETYVQPEKPRSTIGAPYGKEGQESTLAWTCVADGRLRLAAISLIERHAAELDQVRWSLTHKTISLDDVTVCSTVSRSDTVHGTYPGFELRPRLKKLMRRCLGPRCVLPHLGESCLISVCLASPRCVLPHLGVSCLTSVCLASPRCVWPHLGVSCLISVCLASPRCVLPHLGVSCLTSVCLAHLGVSCLTSVSRLTPRHRMSRPLGRS